MDRTAYVRSLLGRPYDKAVANCWHLVVEVQRELFGRELPSATDEAIHSERERAALMTTSPARLDWREVETPQDGALAFLGRVPSRPIHAGVYLSEGGGVILHSDAPHGAVLDSPVELTRSRRWRVLYMVPV